MNICIFTTTIDKKDGGPSRSVPLLAKGLSKVGVDITLITYESENMNIHILEDSYVKLKIIKKGANIKYLEDIIVSGKFDLIHMQNLWNPLYHSVAKIARNHSIPYMMTPRGCLEPWCLRQKYLKKKIALLLYQRRDLINAACILATSDMEATNIRNLDITTPIAIVPNGIDVSEYGCRTDITNVKKQICFISRIHPKKGIEILIEVWSRIAKLYPDWNVVIAGNGEKKYIEELQNNINSRKLENCIKFIPPVFGRDKYRVYSESSLFVLPTFSENFGMVIAEAMSCGVPVITTKGTPWEILNRKNLGWCIDLSIDNLEQVLKEAMDLGQEELFEKGQKSSLFILDNYQYLSVGEKIKLVYEWILDKNHRPEFIL